LIFVYFFNASFKYLLFLFEDNKEFKIIFDPRSEIIHIGGASNDNKYSMVLIYCYKSKKIFFKKHLNKVEGIILNIVFTLEELFFKNETFNIKP